jgi:hypothetical protein
LGRRCHPIRLIRLIRPIRPLIRLICLIRLIKQLAPPGTSRWSGRHYPMPWR